jgi:hypothetical protein
MRKTFLAAAILIVGLATGGAQTVQNGATTPNANDWIHGKVTAISQDVITVKLQGGDTFFVKVGSETKISKETQQPVDIVPAKLEEIKTTDTIITQVRLKGGVLEAISVLINPDFTKPMPMKPGGIVYATPEQIAQQRALGNTFTFMVGTITAVNKDSFTLKQELEGTLVTVRVNEHTVLIRQIQRNPAKFEPAKLEELKAAESVVVSGSMSDGVLVATRVGVNVESQIGPPPGYTVQSFPVGNQSPQNGTNARPTPTPIK